MDLGHLSRRGFVAKSLGAVGGLTVFAGFGRGARASWSSWSSCSSWSWDGCGHHHHHHHHCGKPVDCCAPPPTCCAPQPTCCAPAPCGHPANGYESAPPPAEEAPPAPEAAYRRRYFRAARSRVSRRTRYASLRLLER